MLETRSPSLQIAATLRGRPRRARQFRGNSCRGGRRQRPPRGAAPVGPLAFHARGPPLSRAT
eukprot:6597538-Lingulodinium_polyedra.AAC.1